MAAVGTADKYSLNWLLFLKQLLFKSIEWGNSSFSCLLESTEPICLRGSICVSSSNTKNKEKIFFFIDHCENRKTPVTNLLKIGYRGLQKFFQVPAYILRPPQALITWPVI